MTYVVPAFITEYQPVALPPRHDGWTEIRQYRFLFALAETGRVSVACREAGMSRQSAYGLRAHAKGAAFADAWDRALDHRLGALLEEAVIRQATQSDRSLATVLRYAMPERYGPA